MNCQDPKILDRLERLLVSYIYKEYLGQTWRGENIPKHLFRSFAASARRLSDSFTEKRKDFRGHYLRTKESRSGYLLYFHLASMVRTIAVLEEIRRRGAWPAGPLRILDVGAGSAPSLWAAAFAASCWGNEIESVTAIDYERRILSDANKLWRALSDDTKWKLPPLRTQVVDVRRRTDSSRDTSSTHLVFCSNVLNEVAGEATGLGVLFRNRLDPDGLMVVVEPALRTTSRALQAFRDRFVERTECSIPFPCGHEKPCPLNLEPKDWCHFETSWSPPPVRRRLEKSLGHQTGSLKYSYLVLRQPAAHPFQNGYRVLSDPLSTPQGNRLLLCTPGGKVALGFGKLLPTFRRGDLLATETPLPESLFQQRKVRYAYEFTLPAGSHVDRI
ncbi:MAG TPA: small ribosomal subunit Rsm22 family protein [Bdellovibrionota bacterium]|nr:small ribosomal subunit Rsm22 family protein [Bdellovibrionota bacterium]